MGLDERHREAWRAMQAQRSRDHEGEETNDPLRNRGGGGTSGPMDPWQQSVEARLTSLDGRLGKIEPMVADIKTDVAVLKATIATKADLTGLGDKLTGRMQIYLGLVATLIVIATAVTKYL